MSKDYARAPAVVDPLGRVEVYEAQAAELPESS